MQKVEDQLLKSAIKPPLTKPKREKQQEQQKKEMSK